MNSDANAATLGETPRADARKNRRRQYIINPDFQWRYLRNIVALELLVFVAAVLLTLTVSQLLINSEIMINSYWRVLMTYVVALFVVVAGVLFYLGLRLSNRISGPLYRVQMSLKEVTAGRLPERCTVRDGDEHSELADTLTETLTALRQRGEQTSRFWRKHAEILREVKTSTAPDVADKLELLAMEADKRAREQANA